MAILKLLLLTLAVEHVLSVATEGRCFPYNNLLDPQSPTLNETSGTIPFPTYSDCYSDRIWKITVPPNKRVKLTFTDMDMPYQPFCTSNYVEMRDGLYSFSTRIGRYCGTVVPSPRYSSGRNMWVKFHSDYSRIEKGFKAKYEAVEIGTVEAYCSPYKIGYQSFTLQSPNYPRSYPNNINCIWKITVSSGKKVKLTFTHIDLELNSAGCTNDYVVLRSGLSSYGSSIGQYCGRWEPSPQYSSGRYMWVKFHSDSSITRTGFRADYEAVFHTVTDNTHHSSSGLSSGTITGLIFAGIAVAAFIVSASYCKQRSRTPRVIADAVQPRATGTSTLVVDNVNITEQASAARPPPQHPQAMVNPAYTGYPDCTKSQPYPTHTSQAQLPPYTPVAEGAYPTLQLHEAYYPPPIPGQGAYPPPPQAGYPPLPPYFAEPPPPYPPPGEAYHM